MNHKFKKFTEICLILCFIITLSNANNLYTGLTFNTDIYIKGNGTIPSPYNFNSTGYLIGNINVLKGTVGGSCAGDYTRYYTNYSLSFYSCNSENMNFSGAYNPLKYYDVNLNPFMSILISSDAHTKNYPSVYTPVYILTKDGVSTFLNCGNNFCQLTVYNRITCVNESSYNSTLPNIYYEFDGDFLSYDYMNNVSTIQKTNHAESLYGYYNAGNTYLGTNNITSRPRVLSDDSISLGCLITTSTTTTTTLITTTTNYVSTTTTLNTNNFLACFNVTDFYTNQPVFNVSVIVDSVEEFTDIDGLVNYTLTDNTFIGYVAAKKLPMYPRIEFYNFEPSVNFKYPPCVPLILEPYNNTIINYSYLNLKGKVEDSNNLSGIFNAQITLSGCSSKNNIYTNRSGYFEINNIPDNNLDCCVQSKAAYYYDSDKGCYGMGHGNLSGIEIFMKAKNMSIIPTTTNPNNPLITVQFYTFYKDAINNPISLDDVDITLKCDSVSRSLNTGTDGLVSFNNIPLNAICTYSYSRSGYVGKSNQAINDIQNRIDIQLMSDNNFACDIHGIVKYDNNSLIPNHDVIITDLTTNSQFATLPTDGNGFFKQNVKCGKSYSVSSSINGQNKEVKVTLSQTESDSADGSLTFSTTNFISGGGLIDQTISLLMSLFGLVLLIIFLCFILALLIVIKLMRKAMDQ